MSKQETAAQAYRRNRQALRDRVNKMAEMLSKHEHDFKAEGSKNWGYVGDLAHYNELMAQLLGEEE